MPSTVGFVGLGNMGKLMAINLANGLKEKGAPALRVWNRTTSKAEEVVQEAQQGAAQVASSVEEVAQQCQVIITSLANDTVVQSIYQQLFAVLEKEKRKDVLLIETSTVYPTVSKELHQQAQKVGARFVSALPFGQPPVAKTAQLVFAIGGEAKAVEEATSYLVPHVGRKTMEFGDDPSKASTFKLIGNSIILSTVEMMTESMTLAEKTGVGADRLLEWVHLFYPAPSAINYGNKVANFKFEASGGFDLQGGLKDANHIQKLGQDNNCQMHIVEQAIKHLHSAIEINKDQPNKDWAALSAGQRVESGLPPFSK